MTSKHPSFETVAVRLQGSHSLALVPNLVPEQVVVPESPDDRLLPCSRLCVSLPVLPRRVRFVWLLFFWYEFTSRIQYYIMAEIYIYD